VKIHLQHSIMAGIKALLLFDIDGVIRDVSWISICTSLSQRDPALPQTSLQNALGKLAFIPLTACPLALPSTVRRWATVTAEPWPTQSSITVAGVRRETRWMHSRAKASGTMTGRCVDGMLPKLYSPDD